MRTLNVWQGVLVIVLALVLSAGGLAALQLGPYMASRQLDDLEWYRTTSPQEQRETAHRALGSWFRDPHDAFGVLLRYGDASSIPYLKAAIANRPESERGDTMTCTWFHALDALERIEHPAAWAKRVSKPRPRKLTSHPANGAKPAKFPTFTGPKADLRGQGGYAGRFP